MKKPMVIQIDGAGTTNKGAALMLLATLHQISNKYPKALVVYNSHDGGLKKHIKTRLKIRRPIHLQLGKYFYWIMSRLEVYNLTSYRPQKNVDVLLDISGFRFGDQWKRSNNEVNWIESYYRHYSNQGTKVFFLPQAFGPFETTIGKKTANIINQYADMIFARESVSKNYLIGAGVNNEKVIQCPDFSVSVEGEVPAKYKDLCQFVCIIPNSKMLTHGGLSVDQYVKFLCQTIKYFQSKNKTILLLNHEGYKDFRLSKIINNTFENKLLVASGLTTKEVKGVIGRADLVISSRYHGVASALNQGVPCLATSWSHKYQQLFLDYGIKDGILNVSDSTETTNNKLKSIMDPANYPLTKKNILTNKQAVVKKVESMWDSVWMSV